MGAKVFFVECVFRPCVIVQDSPGLAHRPSTPGRSGVGAINRPASSSLKFTVHVHSYNNRYFCGLQRWIQNKTQRMTVFVFQV